MQVRDHGKMAEVVTTYTGKSVKDVPAQDFINAFGAYLKSTGKVRYKRFINILFKYRKKQRESVYCECLRDGKWQTVLILIMEPFGGVFDGLYAVITFSNIIHTLFVGFRV